MSKSGNRRTADPDGRKGYRAALRDLQIELVKVQRHIIKHGHRVLVIFEGRDAAGKDGTIKRIVQHLSPRDIRVVALGKPSDHDRASWYFQRYVPHLPSTQEMILFNRSWYNRAGVEYVMGFCSTREYEDFLGAVLPFEHMLIGSGIQIMKYYLDISKNEQKTRLRDRKTDPLKQWKLSPMDVQSRARWEQYTKAKEEMLYRTHIPDAPWWVVEAVDKKRARLNCIAHLLTQIPYGDVRHEAAALPDRTRDPDYHRESIPAEMYVPSRY